MLLASTPAAANPHSMPKTVQPSRPRNETSVNGV
jgi:hypothetical protein